MTNAAEASGDVRPVVPLSGGGNLGLYIFLIIVLAGGFWVFSALRSGVEGAAAPITAPDPELGANRISSPPPLALPPLALERSTPAPVLGPQPPPPSQPVVDVRQVEPPIASPAPAVPDMADQREPEPTVVFEERPELVAPPLAREGGEQERMMAVRLENPSFTVPQGTVIPGVLETAFDSTRPGAVRALVQRDVHSFDGTRVLIPRGSRLYGTYEAGINPGERRAEITWIRLLRPDGVTINLDSPASDPLGRAGVEGDVNSRFLARFGGALLQSVLDIGVGVATRRSGDGVYVALPGSTQTITQPTGSGQARPVLEIDHGTSVSIFVAHDLDFSTVGF